jgi:AcrR family transcriptional regulator
MTIVRRHPPTNPGPSRAGDRSRQQLLEAAGEVFAERGYAQATSKEICERAGMNSAAVNYHFGGFEQLYAESLAYAHSHLVGIETLRDIATSDMTPREQLRAYIALMLRRLARPATSWEMRLFSREIISPSPAHDAFIKSEVLPKLAVLRGIIAALIGAAPDDPVVGRCILTVGAPCIMLAIADRAMLSQVVPGLANASEEIEPLIDHFERFIHAGLEATALRFSKSEETASVSMGG